jgi:eukaryotic-like serine/threonine-protein kinase
LKACPTCGRLYPEDAGFCPVDGAGLARASRAPVLPADDVRVGQVLGSRYQVRRVIADGGMGRVYEALDVVEHRSVAIKVLHPSVAADPIQIERFEREFSTSRALAHPCIARVFDFIELGSGQRALVMELLYGEELRDTLGREGTIGPARVVRMVSQASQALDEAHRRHIVHRDLKPANLYLCQTADGDDVRVLDFGSVKDTARGARKLTALGTTIGSPDYMSPEQAQGSAALDHRADVWALAVITFEALTGGLPFTAPAPAQMLLAIVSKRPRVASALARDAGRTLPSSLDRTLEQALCKAPSGRHGSAGAFADALGHAFGLAGDHDDWASWPERRLTAEIEASWPELMAASATPAPSAQDDFFGEAGALEGKPQAPPPLSFPPKLGAMGPQGSAVPIIVSMPPAPVSLLPSVPAGVPRPGGLRSVLMWTLFLGVVVSLGVLFLIFC